MSLAAQSCQISVAELILHLERVRFGVAVVQCASDYTTTQGNVSYYLRLGSYVFGPVCLLVSTITEKLPA